MDNGHVGVCISFSPYSPAHCVNMKAYLRAVLFRGLEKEDKHISQDLLDVWFGLFWLGSMEFVVFLLAILVEAEQVACTHG